jgi:hypothetical protein
LDYSNWGQLLILRPRRGAGSSAGRRASQNRKSRVAAAF